MGTLTVIGVGLEAGQLTLQAAECLRSGSKVILHTNRIGCAQWLESEEINYQSLDGLYDSCEDFDEHAKLAAQTVLTAAETEDVVYAVYDIRDRSVAQILAVRPKTRVIAGPPTESSLLGFVDGNTRMLEASEWENYDLSARECALIREIDSRELASEVKLKLMECYPEESIVYLKQPTGAIAKLPLYEMDRLKAYDHKTCALILPERDITKLEHYNFEDLVYIMELLQAPNGCSWDRVQTHLTLRTCLLEETYEVIEAIEASDSDHLCEELGDLMMNIVMQAVIAKKHGEFTIEDSLTSICEKMIQRHTHIFGKDRAADPNAVLDLWTKNKMRERGQTSYTQVLREASKALPALMRAEKICGKAKGSGVVCPEFDHPDEYLDALTDHPLTETVLGDALLSLCAMAKTAGIDAEIALNDAADRFIDRFEKYESDKNA